MPETPTRSALRLPRVEFDLPAVILGAAAWLGQKALWSGLAAFVAAPAGAGSIGPGGALQPADPATALRYGFWKPLLTGPIAPPGSQHVAAAIDWTPLFTAGEKAGEYRPAPGIEWGPWTAVAAVLLVWWSVAGGAVARAFALRKTRDESPGAFRSVGFALRNLPAFLMGPAFMLGAVALFVVAGLAASAAPTVPFAGPVLAVVAGPLLVVVSIVLAVLVLGATLGLPLFQASVAVDRNGFLDAVSRTYTYAFARPVQYAVGGIVAVAVAAALERFCSWTLELLASMLMFGSSVAGGDPGPVFSVAVQSAVRLGTPAFPEGAPGDLAASGWVLWVVLSLALLLARGWLLAYVVGAFVDLYLILREDVEGTSPTEVYSDESPAPTLTDPPGGGPR